VATAAAAAAVVEAGVAAAAGDPAGGPRTDRQHGDPIMRQTRVLAPLLALLIGAAGVAGAETGPSSRAVTPETRAEAGDGGRLQATAAGRYAVVIGNAAYDHVPDLENAAADARAMAEFLRGRGFEVIERHDLDKRGFEALMRRILVSVRPDSELLFYYAGHGIQIGRRNYLLPVDAELDGAYDVHFETITLDSIVAFLSARSRKRVVILDSCRDNPFADARLMTEIDPSLFETRDGFSAMSAPVNTLIAYATSPGRVAYDGAGDNSPFTDALIRLAAAERGRELGGVLSAVRREVYAGTDGLQVPWESSTLVEPFSFDAGAGEARSVLAQLPAGGEAAPGGGAVRSAPPADLWSVTGGPATGLRVEGPLERSVRLGAVVAPALGLGPDAEVRVEAVEVEEGGALAWRDGASPLTPETALDAAGLRGVRYEFAPEPVRAAADPAVHAETERFALEIAEGGGTRRVEVELAMTPDPCDHEAGDWLDPEGVGVARYPNEIDPDAALAACRAAVERQPENGRFHYQLGRALQAAERYEDARAAFERARALDHTRSLATLGTLVARQGAIAGGALAEAASDEALALWLEGVDRGDPYAYHWLGRDLLRFGESDGEKLYGFELLTRALELGHTFSMNELGYYFLREDSPNQEPRRGLRYLEESAAREDIYGYHNLGLVYDKGLGGIEPDAEAARRWYEAAAEGGHPFAPINLGRMHFEGRLGGGEDLVRAIEWYDRGLAAGGAWGGANAAWIIANRGPEGYAPADAAVRAAKAAALNDAEAAASARQVLAGLAPGDLDRATQLLLRELGREVTVDGVIGPRTEAAVAAILETEGVAAPADPGPEARLAALAEAYWSRERFRIDLY